MTRDLRAARINQRAYNRTPKARARVRARDRATRRLVQLHRQEWRDLYAEELTQVLADGGVA